MKIIEYFTSEEKEHWLQEISKSDWDAGQFLYTLLKEGRLKEMAGETALVLLLTDEKKLVSYCTFAPLDDIQPTPYGPWIGFVYTYPEYRGHHYAGRLIAFAESLADIMGKECTYISSGHIGLYEKYGYEFLETVKEIFGGESRIYRKRLDIPGQEKEERRKAGDRNKAILVEKARKNCNPIGYCGLSCDECKYTKWCGGCRSVFSCCSYGTLFEKGKCPNSTCCKEKNLQSCLECEEKKQCTKGIYSK